MKGKNLSRLTIGCGYWRGDESDMEEQRKMPKEERHQSIQIKRNLCSQGRETWIGILVQASDKTMERLLSLNFSYLSYKVEIIVLLQ